MSKAAKQTDDDATGEAAEKKPKCCHIPCGRDAAFYIREQGTTHANRPDAGDTYSCAGHLLDMLGHSGEPLPGTTVSYNVTPL